MERVHQADPVLADQLGGAAVVVFRKGRHVGILFREVDMSTRVLHLCDHRVLRCDPPSEATESILYVVPDLDPISIETVSAFARLVRNRHLADGIPYGFSPPDQFLDSSASFGTVPGEGLTCASLILAVFHRSGVPLVAYDTWETDEHDLQQQLRFVIHFRDTDKMTHEEANALATTIGRARYRPLQVAGAACADGLPADYTTANRFADKLQGRLS